MNKVEASGKARPRIGTVFVKAKVLSQQNVQRIYQAIEKRGGRSAASSAAEATAARPRRGAQRQGRGRTRVERRPAPKMDRQTLTFGIISLVVLVVAALAMGIMVIGQRSSGDVGVVTPSSQTGVTTSNTAAPADFKGALLGGGPAKPAEPQSSINEAAREQFRAEHLVAIQDARRDRGENFANALRRLASFKTQRAQYYEMFADLAQELETEIADIDRAMRDDMNVAFSEAQNLVGEGDQLEAVRVLEGIRDRVTEELKAVIDERKKDILQ